MKFNISKVINEKLFAGIRSLGVGIALAGSVALFFGQSLISAVVALIIGIVILASESYTD